MYKLHYAKIDLGDNDIPTHKFKTFNKMVEFIENNLFDEYNEPVENKVFLLTYNSDYTAHDAIFIDACVGEILDHLEHMKTFTIDFVRDDYGNSVIKSEIYETYHLQEYESYEDAYEVALTMRETCELCYRKN